MADSYVTAREWELMRDWQLRQDVAIESHQERLDQVDELVASNRAMRRSWDRLTGVIATSATALVLAAVGIILFGRGI